MASLRRLHHLPTLGLLAAVGAALGAGASCGDSSSTGGSGGQKSGGGNGGKADSSTGSANTGGSGGTDTGKDGPVGNDVNKFPHADGDATAGRDLFRYETFGDENFWTDAVQLPQGIVAAKLTPVQALKNGYNINIDALDPDTQAAIAKELKTDLTPANAPMLNDPATTLALINANAVIGVVVKDTNGDGKLDATAGDKVGVSCAFCHAMTDGSVFSLPKGGTIGKEVDGPTPHNLNVGATFALAANTRALYPIAQLALVANKGATIGRAPTGLTGTSSEADFDAYFNNPDYYPIGMFDDQPDGTGAPMHITPMFRGDLSAPYGSEGTIDKLDNFTNLVFTVLFDQRDLLTPSGRKFLHTVGGAAGDEIADTYLTVLTATGVPTTSGLTVSKSDGTPGTLETPVGLRVDDTKLLNMNAYMDGLQAPKGKSGDADTIAKGRDLFRHQCTSCHNVDQGKFVPSALIPMKTIFPGDNPVDLGARMPPLNDFLNTVDSIFDDKMVVVNASIRGDIRGIAMPLLLDLARKPVFLHDNSVPTLDNLLDESRGADAPHPFYLSGDDKATMVIYLESLDTDSK